MKTMRDEYEDMLYYMHMADNEKLSDDTRKVALALAQDCKFRIRKLRHDFSKPIFAYEHDGHRGDFGFDGESYICRIFVSDSKSMSDEDKSRICDYYDRPYQYCDYDCTGQWFGRSCGIPTVGITSLGGFAISESHSAGRN